MRSGIIIGLIIIFLGVMVNLARRNETIKAGIEKYVLGGDDLFSTDKEYRRIVSWLGWPSILLGAGVMVPTSLLWDAAIVIVVLLLVFRARREYDKFVEEKKRQQAQDAAATAEA